MLPTQSKLIANIHKDTEELIMAYRESVQNQELKVNLGGSQYFWNIHKNVGYGYKNHKSDVMLVQFLLNSATRSFGFNENLLEEDGLFGGKTWRAIKNYQESGYWSEYSDTIHNMLSDGCVTATNGTRYLSRRRKVPYTILMLNLDYFRSQNLYFQDIRRDPNIPTFLVEQLTGMPEVV